MIEINKLIIDLIGQNKSIKEICKIIGISEKQLYVRIKQIINYGYLLEPIYSYNSDIYYTFQKNTNVSNLDRVEIQMSKDNNLFRCIVVADMHIGCVDGDIRLMHSVYEYAIKNGINVIFNCGDIIEGDYTEYKKTLKTLDAQVEYLIKKYPYDRNINNFNVFGNHEFHSLHSDGFDVAKAINNSRYDIIPVGYGQGNVFVKNDSIILFHKLRDDFKPIINGEKILLSGHGHMMKTKLRDIFWLGIPTLSYKSNDKTKDVVPGFVDLSIELEKNKFIKAEAKHMIITPKIIQVSEVRGKVKNLFKDNK